MTNTKNALMRILFVLTICLILPGSSAEVLAAPPGATYTVINTNMSGAGSLDQAIRDSEAHPGHDKIEFNIPFTDPGYNATTDTFTIYLTTLLYSISDTFGVWIDGNTQPTANVDSRPNIVIDASSWATAPNVLVITTLSNNTVIQGLTLKNSNGDVVWIDGSNTWIDGCEIAGSAIGYGINITANAANNRVAFSYIYGNGLGGININSSNGNIIYESNIGVEPAYITTDLPNGGDGISVLGSDDTQIKDNVINDNLGDGIQIVLGDGTQILRNNLSGNLANGLYCNACTNSLIEENIIGLSDFDYSAYGNGNDGIRMENGSAHNDIFSNFVSGNAWNGIHLRHSGTTDNYLESNVIGYGYYGGFIPNGQHGIGLYENAYWNYIGSYATKDGANLIGGNGWSGVAVVGPGLGQNYIHNNYILFNQWYGVHVDSSQSNSIAYNVIHHNGLHGTHAGVRIQGGVAVYNAITENSIHANTGLGIELVDGGNHSLAEPLIYSANCTTVSGTTCADCVVRIYSDDEYEGEVYEGYTTADSSGNFSFTKPTGCFTGPNITATAHDGWDTSPFALPAVGVCRHFYLPLIFK